MKFQVWFRGRLCTIEGYVESADPRVGIPCDYFVAEEITPTGEGMAMGLLNAGPTSDYEEPIDTITDSEWRDLDAAYWASLPFEPGEHVVWEWGIYD